MPERNIFIGLGGSGVSTVAALKYKIYANTPGENPYEALNKNYKFIFIDTDQADVNKQNAYYKSKFEGGRRLFIDPKNELINLGTVNPNAVYEEALAKTANNRTDIDNAVLEACTEKFAKKLKPYPLKDGAGAYRYNSRIAFARMAYDFVDMLKTDVQQLLDTRTAGIDGVTLRYWIVGSCNGGTGSGTFTDVLYLVNMLHKSFRRSEEPKTTLVMYMPRFYIDGNKGDKKYICNAQASFMEMDGYQAMSRSGNLDFEEKVHQMLFHPMNLQIEDGIRYRPFSSCIPIDIQTENGNNLMSPQAMYSNTAELLFFIHQSQGRDPLASSFKSDADNHLDDLVIQNPLNYLQAMGYVALRKPETEFESYIDHRLKLELLSYGLLSPFPENLDLKQEISSLYDSIVRKELFSNEPDTFSEAIDSIVKRQINRSFSDNLLKEDDKVRKHLPSGISQAAADKVVSQFTLAMDDIYEGITGYGDDISNRYSKKAILSSIEEKLWTWVEEQTFKKGLNYVKQVLDGLDIYATEQLTKYTNGRGSESVFSLSENVNRIMEQLPDLRQKAETVSLRERLWDSNEHDIRRYYSQLLEYIKAKGNLLLSEKKYELLATLCKGDNGIIDKMRSYINELQAAAIGAAKAPEDNYRGLAQFFENSARDITTVYLPEISKFVKNGGWDTDNFFSRLYSEVLEPSSRLIPAHGFAPKRTCDESQEHSVEAFLRKMVEYNKKEMIAEGYYAEEEGNSHSTIFRKNRWSDNPSKIIQDILMYAENTYEKAYKNDVLKDKWYNLTLEELFMRLTIEEQQEIRRMLSPQLFYSYKNAVIENGREFNYVIAPTKQMAENVFRFQEGSPSWRLDLSSSSSVAYMLRARIGLPISSYMLYDMIKQYYRNEVDKSCYHTHAAWGECSGDYHKLRMPDRVEKELIVYAKYLMMNEYAGFISDLFYCPELSAEVDYYKQTPLLINEDTMAFASASAIDIIKDYVALHYDGNTFDEYVASGPDVLYSSIYKTFKKNFIEKKHEVGMNTLLNQLAESSEMKRNYNKVKSLLVQKLNDLYTAARREDEKKVLLNIIRLFGDENELSDYTKFIG